LLSTTIANDSAARWYDAHMARVVVGVLRGGPSSEYDLSLKTGTAILNALPESEYDLRDIFIDKKGYWHARGIPVEPWRALAQVDVVINGLHGGPGEDGTVQRMLKTLGVPFTGSSALASGLSLNKIQTGIELKKAGIRMPLSVGFTLSSELNSADMARFVFREFGPPYIVKPAREGASHGVVLVQTFFELGDAIADMLEAFGNAVVQEYVVGEEATVGIIDDFRGEELYALPPARVVYPESSPFLHFDHHHSGEAHYLVPSEFTHAEKATLADIARTAHRALGLSHASRADFIMTPRGPVFLEVNALPGLYEGAAFPAMLESVGASTGEYLGHAIGLARQ
jgi:D-alanine-D-alanine ligase